MKAADADAWETATRPSSNRNPVASSHRGGNAWQNLTKAGRAGVKNGTRLLDGSVARRELSRLRMYLATPMALGSGNCRHRYEASWTANNYNNKSNNNFRKVQNYSKSFQSIAEQYILWLLNSHTCFSSCGWFMSSGIKSKQMCMEGMPATVTGRSSTG